MPITTSTHGMTIIDIINLDVDGVSKMYYKRGHGCRFHDYYQYQFYLPLFKFICCISKSTKTIKCYTEFLVNSYYRFRDQLHNLKLLVSITKGIKMFLMWINLHRQYVSPGCTPYSVTLVLLTVIGDWSELKLCVIR